jgi:hypothetical protein
LCWISPRSTTILITSGTVTNYESQNGRCTAEVYTGTPTQPATLVDEGGDHVHQIVNTGGTVATGYAVQLIPAGATRRIDAPQPEKRAPWSPEPTTRLASPLRAVVGRNEIKEP